MAEDLRHRYAEAIRSAADFSIVGEWICCDPIKPDHDLCVRGDIARQMLAAVLMDDPERLFVPSKLVDAVMAVRDEELNRVRARATKFYDTIGRAVAERDEWRERAETAEAAVARVRHLCELTIAASCRVQAVDHARDTLAALDASLPPEEGTL